MSKEELMKKKRREKMRQMLSILYHKWIDL